ncbi:hypothetical protein E2542_SST13392 [Spatholobus suberectus]|nr:hypothetical protein E2542_SST13392 [Spatholobus suberectus]
MLYLSSWNSFGKSMPRTRGGGFVRDPQIAPFPLVLGVEDDPCSILCLLEAIKAWAMEYSCRSSPGTDHGRACPFTGVKPSVAPPKNCHCPPRVRSRAWEISHASLAGTGEIQRLTDAFSVET